MTKSEFARAEDGTLRVRTTKRGSVMWNKDEKPDQTHELNTEPTESFQPPVARVLTSELATIGRSIKIKGEVTGDEDLMIQGRVEGSVDLKQHSVTVGADGEVKASITARVVTVEGKVEGDLTAEEQVVLLSSACVEGDIAAPTLVLEDGARFSGGVDMGDVAKRQVKTDRPTPPQAKVAPDVSSRPLGLGDDSSENGTKAKDAPATLAT